MSWSIVLPVRVIVAMADPMTTVCVFPGVVGKRQMSTPDQHALFSDNVANRRYDQNLSRRHGLTEELVSPDERRGQPLGPSLVSVVIRAFMKRVIHPPERGLLFISGCFVWLTFPPARMTSRLG